MAWIESHQSLKEHPKVLDLMNLMGWSLDETIGKLHRFWWWCVDYAEDGDLRKHNDSRLAAAVGLNGDAGGQFVESMVKSCWIDRQPYFRVHEWWTYFGRFLQIKYKHNQCRWRRIQELYQNGSENGSLNHIPNQPNQPNQPIKSAFEFDQVYRDYPNKDSRKQAEAHFKTSVITEADFKSIQAALRNYKDHLARNTWKKPQSAKTWFNNWQDWVNYVEPKTEKDQRNDADRVCFGPG